MKIKLKYFIYIAVVFIAITSLFIGYYFYEKYSIKKNNYELINFLINGTPPDRFNKKLAICEINQYGIDSDGFNWYGTDSYSIRGIKDRKCILIKFDSIYYRNGSGKSSKYTCGLPYEIYSNPNTINWAEIFKSGFCSLNETIH